MERVTDKGELDWLGSRAIPASQPSGESPRELDETETVMRELADRLAIEIDAGPTLASFLGIDAVGWDASVWIIHAMWETDALPGGLTQEEIRRIERAGGMVEAHRAAMSADQRCVEQALDEVLDGATFVNAGYRDAPGPEWTRLRWAELCRRLGLEATSHDGPPSHLWSPYESWPANVTGPGEGSLDEGQLECLLRQLEAVSPCGAESTCFASYGACAVGDFDADVLYQGRLREIRSLFDDEDLSGSPSNFWPEDRSWLVYTNWDLWGTKVSGDAVLIQRLTSDPGLEIVDVAAVPDHR